MFIRVFPYKSVILLTLETTLSKKLLVRGACVFNVGFSNIIAKFVSQKKTISVKRIPVTLCKSGQTLFEKDVTLILKLENLLI